MSDNKNEKPIYFTVDQNMYAEMKVLCAKYGFSVKDLMTTIIKQAVQIEKDLTK